ncbi:MAG: hypothetical protein ABSH05_24280 [Bryobacteraceae bacterium]
MAEFRIPVENDVSVRARQREGFAQLLQDPVAGRVCAGVEVQDPATAMFDHEKAVQNAEHQCRHGEEVQRGNHFAMSAQESEPALRVAGVTAAFQLVQVARDRGLRDLKAELEQFAVNAGCAPHRILCFHAPDQLSEVSTDFRSSRPTKPGTEPPKEAESGPMPSDDGFRLHQNQHFRPVRPKTAQQDPKEPVRLAQPGPRLFPFEDRQLLAKGGGLQAEEVARHKEGAEVGDHREPVRNRLNLFANGDFDGPQETGRLAHAST